MPAFTVRVLKMVDSRFLTFVNAGSANAGVDVSDTTGRLPGVLGDVVFSITDVCGNSWQCIDIGKSLRAGDFDVKIRIERLSDDAGVRVFTSLTNTSDKPVRLATAGFETIKDARGPSLEGEPAAWSRYRMGFNTTAPSGAVPLTVPDRDFFMRFPPYSWLPESAMKMVYFDGTSFSSKVGVFESEWFSALVHRPSGRGALFGFYGVSRHFSRVKIDLKKKKVSFVAFLDGAVIEPGQTRELDPLMIAFGDDFNALLDTYARAAAVENKARVNPARIWCSWYSGFYDRVTVKDIRENLRRLSLLKSPVEYIQLDDGYQSVIGDWLQTNSRFPEGLEALACEIGHAGFKPGIWTAPFSVSPASQLFAAHSDWVVRTKSGKPVKAGFIMGKFGPRPYYALDTTIPEVRQHISSLFARLREMGWSLFKIDFLTSAMIEGVRRDNSKTRAEAYRLGMQAVRDGVGDDGLILTGIGPFLTNVGLIDIQRLSPDTCFGSPSWTTMEQRLTGDRMTPGVRNQTAVSIGRTFTNDILWSGDPDAIVGPGLAPNEAVYLKTVALMTGSSLTIGHDFVKAPFDFSGFGPLLDAVGPARVLDFGERMDSHHLMRDVETDSGKVRFYAMLNASDQAETLFVADGVLAGGCRFAATDHWTGEGLFLEKDKSFELGPRSAKLFVIRPDSERNSVE